jgi:hypothetical protein
METETALFARTETRVRIETAIRVRMEMRRQWDVSE